MSAIKGGILSRDELKMLIGGDDTLGDCQANGSPCSTAIGSNCCNGLACADFTCYPKG
jgi:hypothetical protein